MIIDVCLTETVLCIFTIPKSAGNIVADIDDSYYCKFRFISRKELVCF